MSRVRGQALVKGDALLKFYAGVPLIASDGQVIGVLYALESHVEHACNACMHAWVLPAESILSHHMPLPPHVLGLILKSAGNPTIHVQAVMTATGTFVVQPCAMQMLS